LNYANNSRIFNHLFFDTPQARHYHGAPMSTTRVPRHADLRKLAAAGVCLAGSIPIAQLGRLCAELLSSTGDVAVELQFGVDDEGLRVIEGNAEASLSCTCQRCLGEMCLVVQARINLAMVRDEAQLAALPTRIDGLVVGDEPADLYGIVEDELLLALPFAPRHADEQCSMAVEPVAALAGDAGGERVKPFAEALELYKLDRS
jgi:uncharacterized protein